MTVLQKKDILSMYIPVPKTRCGNPSKSIVL